MFSQDIEPYRKNQRNYHCQEIVPVVLSRNLRIVAAELFQGALSIQRFLLPATKFQIQLVGVRVQAVPFPLHELEYQVKTPRSYPQESLFHFQETPLHAHADVWIADILIFDSVYSGSEPFYLVSADSDQGR